MRNQNQLAKQAAGQKSYGVLLYLEQRGLDISTDNSIGEDAKVTILATGMEEVDCNENVVKDDAYYESLIPLLYRPITKPVPEPAPEPNFVVEPAPEPEPSVVMEEGNPQYKQTAFERFTQWMKSIVQEVDE